MKLRLFSLVLLVSAALAAHAQQVVQRGALGHPASVFDETGQWTTPLLVASAHDVEIYIPDVSSPDWLKQNYASWKDGDSYTLTLFTFYKTPEACRANQTGWGLADAAHLNACYNIGYRIRRGLVDAHGHFVQLLEASMADKNGNLDPASTTHESVHSSWDRLDPNTAAALRKANALIQEQMTVYDRHQQEMR